MKEDDLVQVIDTLAHCHPMGAFVRVREMYSSSIVTYGEVSDERLIAMQQLYKYQVKLVKCPRILAMYSDKFYAPY